MAYLSPDLVQKALSISSSFAKGGMVAKFQDGGDVDDDYGTFGADELSNDDPMGMADAVAEAIEKGNTGTTAAEVSAAIDALSDLDRGEGGGSLEERDRAIQSLLDQAERDSAPPPDTGGAVPPPRDDATTPTPTAAEAIRGPAVDPAIQEAIKAQAAVQAARAAVPEPERETVTGKALQVDEFGPLFDTPATRPTVPTDGIGAVLTEGYDMAGRPTIPGISDDDVDQGAADVGALAKELGIDVKDVDFRKRGLADLLKPGGIIKDIGGLFTGEGALKEAAAGGQVVKNEEGKTVGVVSYDDEGKVSRVTPVGIKESFDPALRDAYRDFYANQPEERDSDGGEPILPEDVAVEEVEAAPKKPPTIDIIPFRPEDFYYLTEQQRQGLPSMMNMRRS